MYELTLTEIIIYSIVLFWAGWNVRWIIDLWNEE